MAEKAKPRRSFRETILFMLPYLLLLNLRPEVSLKVPVPV